MKVTLVVLGFACFVGALNALPLEETNESELVPQVLPNFEEEETFPSFDEAFAAGQGTPRPPQIHHNVVDLLGPFSARSVNVVSNENGVQETLQKNKIIYNFNGVLKTLAKMQEEEEQNE